jgi:hypothetical protein
VTHFEGALEGHAWEKISNAVKVKVYLGHNEESSMMKKIVT